MNNKKQLNTFISGMMLDSHPSTASDTMLTNCLNGTLITYGDNLYVLLNDLGNGKIYSDKEKLNPAQLPHELFFNQETESKYSLCENLYRPVGMKEHNGILYIVSLNIKSKLYYLYKENPSINEWKKADTVTLSVSNTCKYIINIEVTAADYDTLQTLKVGYLKHYNDLGEEVDSTELTVELFLLRIKDDINKIDFLEIRHLDDEDSIIYKGSEIGSFPSPLWSELTGIYGDTFRYKGKNNEEKEFNVLYDSDGYKLEESTLLFGDTIEIKLSDTDNYYSLLSIPWKNPKLLKNLINLFINLIYKSYSVDITNSFDYNENDKSLIYKPKYGEYGNLVTKFVRNGITFCDTSSLFLTGNLTSEDIILNGTLYIYYNAPDGDLPIDTSVILEHIEKALYLSNLTCFDSFRITYENTLGIEELIYFINGDNYRNQLSKYYEGLYKLNYYLVREFNLNVTLGTFTDIFNSSNNNIKLSFNGITPINEIDFPNYAITYNLELDKLILSLFTINIFYYENLKTICINRIISKKFSTLSINTVNLRATFVSFKDIESSKTLIIDTIDFLKIGEVDSKLLYINFDEDLSECYYVIITAEVIGDSNTTIVYIDTLYFINYSDFTGLYFRLFRQDINNPDLNFNTGRIIDITSTCFGGYQSLGPNKLAVIPTAAHIYNGLLDLGNSFIDYIIIPEDYDDSLLVMKIEGNIHSDNFNLLKYSVRYLSNIELFNNTDFIFLKSEELLEYSEKILSGENYTYFLTDKITYSIKPKIYDVKYYYNFNRFQKFDINSIPKITATTQTSDNTVRIKFTYEDKEYISEYTTVGLDLYILYSLELDAWINDIVKSGYAALILINTIGAANILVSRRLKTDQYYFGAAILNNSLIELYFLNVYIKQDLPIDTPFKECKVSYLDSDIINNKNYFINTKKELNLLKINDIPYLEFVESSINYLENKYDIKNPDLIKKDFIQINDTNVGRELYILGTYFPETLELFKVDIQVAGNAYELKHYKQFTANSNLQPLIKPLNNEDISTSLYLLTNLNITGLYSATNTENTNIYKYTVGLDNITYTINKQTENNILIGYYTYYNLVTLELISKSIYISGVYNPNTINNGETYVLI